MLENGIIQPADRISADVASLETSPAHPTRTGRSRRATARNDRNEPTQRTRFVTGGRAILFLSLACWAALLGAALLLFG